MGGPSGCGGQRERVGLMGGYFCIQYVSICTRYVTMSLPRRWCSCFYHQTFHQPQRASSEGD